MPNRKLCIILILAFVILVTSSVIRPILAQGLFEMMCPRCHGKGFVTRISRTSMTSEYEWFGEDLRLRIRATFYNEGDEGATLTLTAWTKYGETTTYDEETFDQYFAPQAYTSVDIVLAASAIETRQLTYNVYAGYNTIICDDCRGTGYVTNWTTVSGTALAIVVLIVVAGWLLFKRKGERVKGGDELRLPLPPTPPPLPVKKGDEYLPPPPTPITLTTKEDDELHLPPPPTPTPQPLSASIEMVQPKEKALQGTIEEEQFLGGFTSANLHLKARGLSSMGYGIYTTNKRIIGINSKKGLIQGVGLILGGVTGLGLILAGRKDSSAKTIAQLEEKKDFEVRKEDVSEIDMMKPHGFRAGYLNIELNSGESIRVTVADKKEFETIRDLMKAFRPEVLKEVNPKE